MNGALQFFALPVSAASPTAGWLAFLAAMSAKSTFVLAAAWIAALLLRRASAATRHVVWTAAFGALLSLPLFSLALPAWRVTLRVAASQGATVRAPETAVVAAAPGQLPSGPATVASEAKAGIPWPAWILLVWGAGLSVVLSRLVLGTARLRRIARRAVKLDGIRCDLVRQLSLQMGIHRTVTVLESDQMAMPMATGAVRPVILLPGAAAAWPLERLRVVLAHELAHVKRHDCLTQGLAQLACAAYWFHPLAWLGARSLRQEREHASDDRVLSLGTRASDYAGHLVDLARVLRPTEASWSMAVPMASPSHLEARVVAVLNPALNRGTPSCQAAALAFLVMAALLIPVAALRAEKETGKIHGTVYDPSGAVVPDAIVKASNPESKEVMSVSTNQEGVYEFPAVPAARYVLEISKPGFRTSEQRGVLQAGQELRLDVNLGPGQMLQTVTVSAKAPPRAAADQAEKHEPPSRVPHRIRVGGDIQAAKLIFNPNPVYPPKAMEKGIEGTVLMNAVIGMDGRVLDCRVINESDPELAKAALEAVDHWLYQPTLLNGEPIEVVTTITVNFRLEE